MLNVLFKYWPFKKKPEPTVMQKLDMIIFTHEVHSRIPLTEIELTRREYFKFMEECFSYRLIPGTGYQEGITYRGVKISKERFGK